MRFGAVDIGMGVFAFVAGDDATFEGIDLPGMAADIGRARRIADATSRCWNSVWPSAMA